MAKIVTRVRSPKYKFIVRLKGGPGSGGWGHAGRQGKRGGSVPRSSGSFDVMKAGDAMMTKLLNNSQMRRMAAGLAADGGIDDIANITGVIDDVLGTGTAYGDQVAESEGSPVIDKLYGDYEEAVGMQGYQVQGSDITDERKAWEQYHYGRETDGFHGGEKYAIESISTFLSTGKTPKTTFPNAAKPTKLEKAKRRAESGPAMGEPTAKMAQEIAKERQAALRSGYSKDDVSDIAINKYSDFNAATRSYTTDYWIVFAGSNIPLTRSGDWNWILSMFPDAVKPED